MNLSVAKKACVKDAVGEVAIGGAGFFAGYLNHQDSFTEMTSPDHLRSKVATGHALASEDWAYDCERVKLFKTGDLGYANESGNIKSIRISGQWFSTQDSCFNGRTNLRVKLNREFVNLEHIEAVVKHQTHGLKDAAVKLWD